jgi:hypothetical protein
MQGIAAAFKAYVVGCRDLDRSERDDLITFAQDDPDRTWNALKPLLDTELSDATLGYLAVEVIDLLRIYGAPTLWTEVRAQATQIRNLERMLNALDRYYRKYETFFDLLNGLSEVVALPEESNDLPIPNPHDDGARHEHADAAILVSATQKAGFLANDHDSWEAVQSLVDESPTEAWDLALELLRNVPDSAVSWVGIGLLEGLVTYHEREIGPLMLRELGKNRRLREALSSCYLDPSEPFLDSLVEAAAGRAG